MGSVRVVMHREKMRKAVSGAKHLDGPLEEVVAKVTANANSMSSAFRTGIIHRDGREIGDTQPEYVGDVVMGASGYVGLVHPANYAAMKDNHENNTLLKSI